jgi:putative transposase
VNLLPPPPLSAADHPACRLALFALHAELSRVEDLLAERGLDISYETVRCWVLKFGAGDRATAMPVSSTAERSLAPRRDGGADRRPRMYLWRAFDHESEVLDMLVQRQRDGRAALRLMRKLRRQRRDRKKRCRSCPGSPKSQL